MSDRYEVKRSSIHGRGLFAKKRIRKGSWIGTYKGPKTRKDGMHVLWMVDDEGRQIGINGKNALRYVNHSRKPNAEFVGPDLHAIRNIQPGVEITFHYGEDWVDIG